MAGEVCSPEEPCSEGHAAELPVPRVAQTRHDEHLVVEPLVDRTYHQPQRQAGSLQPGDALRRREGTEQGDVEQPRSASRRQQCSSEPR